MMTFGMSAAFASKMALFDIFTLHTALSQSGINLTNFG